MRIRFNQPVPVSKPEKKKLPSTKSEKPEMVKKKAAPVVDKDEIRAKIAAHKAELANPAVKKVAADSEQLKQILKKSNFNYSAKERQVFAKILAKK